MDLSVLSDLCDDYSDDFVVDLSEVDKRLSSIKIHKAPGPDGIPNWLLRDFSSFHRSIYKYLDGGLLSLIVDKMRAPQTPLLSLIHI